MLVVMAKKKSKKISKYRVVAVISVMALLFILALLVFRLDSPKNKDYGLDDLKLYLESHSLSPVSSDYSCGGSGIKNESGRGCANSISSSKRGTRDNIEQFLATLTSTLESQPYFNISKYPLLDVGGGHDSDTVQIESKRNQETCALVVNYFPSSYSGSGDEDQISFVITCPEL